MKSTAKLQEWIDQHVRDFPQINIGEISDGLNTFNDLYKVRDDLFIKLCMAIHGLEAIVFKYGKDKEPPSTVFKRTTHFDGTALIDSFILGKGQAEGEYLVLPISRWDECKFAPVDTLIYGTPQKEEINV